MKRVILICVLISSFTIHGQETIDTKNLFVRVFDMQGNKIAKGVIVSWSENGLVLQQNKKSTEVPFNNISKIKLKRSGGHHIGIGALFGATVGGVFGLTTDDGLWLSQGENSAAMAIVGAMLGSALGGVSAALKENKTLLIEGDISNWEKQVRQNQQP